MNVFHLLFLLGTIAAIFAAIPQLRKLLVAKQADEFNASTWMIWLLSQVTALAYALSEGDVLYSMVAACWLIFYAGMIALIFRYSGRTRSIRSSSLRRFVRYFSSN